MAARRKPVKWVLILVVVGVVGVGAAVAVWWKFPGALSLGQHNQRPTPTRTVTATVVEPVPCSAAGGTDRVEVKIDGRTHAARLDGCGHQKGEAVRVQVPTRGPVDNTTLRAASVGNPGAGQLTGKLQPVLLALAAAAGGMYGFLIRRRTTPKPPRHPQLDDHAVNSSA